jgi:hypothetical protein
MTIILDDHKKELLQKKLREISASLTRIEAERDLIKTIVEDASTELQLEGKTIRKVAKIYHKQNLKEETEIFEEVQHICESVGI